MNTSTVPPSAKPSWLSIKRLWKPALTVLLLVLGVFFVRREGPQLAQAINQLPQTPFWIAALATAVSGLYLICCGTMYVGGFAAAGGRIPLGEAVLLWLRRNFISVFLPAGGVSSMAFYNRSLRQPRPNRPGLSDQQIYTGSLVYLVAGYGSLIIVTLPVLALGLGRGLIGSSSVWSILVLVLLVGLLLAAIRSFQQKGGLYRLLQRYMPGVLAQLEPLFAQQLAKGPLWLSLAASVGVEICGVMHVALAIWAVGGQPTVSLALTTYVVATLLFALSPVMRGLGTVEASMTLVLTRAGGMELAPALAATLYYRLFEFWLPLVAGLLSFVWQRGNLLLRVLPAFLTLMLGVVNLLSALTPALAHRVRLLEEFVPLSVIEASKLIVIGTGMALIILSIGLLRGYRLAWILTTALVSVSILTHLTKAIDYEEALLAGSTLLVLLYTRTSYNLTSPSANRLTRLRKQSRYPILNETTDEVRATAQQLLERYGRGSLDYFKLYSDKELYILPEGAGFFAYRRSGRYVVVLEGPVCAVETYTECVRTFDAFCRKKGYQTLYLRVDQADRVRYEPLRKKALHIGQEGLIDLRTFSLEGREQKSLRNALKRVESGGFRTQMHEPPLRDSLVQQLQAVSDEWLRVGELSEQAFVQGVFRAKEIKQQPVVTVQNAEGKVMAFANVIPDYAPGEGTYDLIRKTADAPSGVSDVLIVALVQYFQQQGMSTLNIGLAPLSGLNQTQNVAERAIKLAYERIRAFSHFRGLRAFKEKYADEWRDKYLIYSEDLDLVSASVAIQQVGRYEEEEN